MLVNLLTMADEQDEHAFMPVKNAQGMRISSGQRHMALNIYNKHLVTEGISKSQAVALTASDSGISKSTVWKIVKEIENEGTISSPPKKRSRATLFTNLDEDQKKSIRRTVHNFFQRNEIPTLDKILQAITENETIPPMSRSTVWKILKELGFRFEKRGRNHMLLEKPDLFL